MRTLLLGSVLSVLSLSAALAQTPDELIQRLKDPDAKTRRLAAEALGKKKDVAAIPGLVELLNDKDRGVQEAAEEALQRIGPKAAPALAEALSAQEASGRYATMRLLKRMGADAREALPALVAALEHKDIGLRISAAIALGSLGSNGKTALPALFEAAKDTSHLQALATSDGSPVSVTVAAIDAALKIDPNCKAALARTVLPDLTAALQSKDQLVLMAVGQGLSRFGPLAKDAVPALKDARARARDAFIIDNALRLIDPPTARDLQELVVNPKESLANRKNAIQELIYRRDFDDKNVPVLIGLLKDPEPQIRATAAEAISHLGLKARTAVPELLKLLGDEEMQKADPKMSYEDDGIVVRALARMGSQAVPDLVAILKDTDQQPRLRSLAARALTRMGRRAQIALPVLEGALKDKNPTVAVQSACAYALAGGDLAKALPILEGGLKESSADLVYSSVKTVDQLGSRASATVPLLVPLLKEPQSRIRWKALNAWSQMGAAARPTVPEIAGLLKLSNPDRRNEILRALQTLGPNAREALPALLELLPNLDSTFPNPILAAITSIGPDAKAAVPALLEELKKQKGKPFSQEKPNHRRPG